MTVLDLFQLHGKVAVVTGASSGLGVAAAQALAEAGADVALGARRVDRLADTGKLVEAAGRRALTVQTDVRRPENCRRLIDQTVETLGRVDILLNNAGVGAAVPASLETPEQFRSVLKINLEGCYWMAQAAARVMPVGSSIINVVERARHRDRGVAAGRVRRVKGRPAGAYPGPRGTVDLTQGHPGQRGRARFLRL